MEENMNDDVMSMLDGIDPSSARGAPPIGDFAVKVIKAEQKTTKSGGKAVNLTLKVANGEREGATIYHNFNTKVLVTQEKIDKLMADGMSSEDAEAKAKDNADNATKGGLTDLKSFLNAAGLIDPKFPGKTGEARIASGQAVPIPAGITFSELLSMLEGRYLMVTTKPGKSFGSGKDIAEVKKWWDADPTRVGDLGASCPF